MVTQAEKIRIQQIKRRLPPQRQVSLAEQQRQLRGLPPTPITAPTPKEPILTPEEIKALEEKITQEARTKTISKLDDESKVQQKRLDDLKVRQDKAGERGDRAEFNILDDEIGDVRRELKAIGRTKDLVKKGEIPPDPQVAVSFASQTARKQIIEAKERKEARIIEKRKEEIIEVFVEGKGFSVAPEQQEKFIQEQLEKGLEVKVGTKIFKPKIIKVKPEKDIFGMEIKPLPFDIPIIPAKKEDLPPPKVIAEAEFFDIGIGGRIKGLVGDVRELGIRGFEFGVGAIGFIPTVISEVGKEVEKIKIEERIEEKPFFPTPEFGTRVDLGISDIGIAPLTVDKEAIENEIAKSEKRQENIEQAVKELPAGGIFGGEISSIAKEENLRLELEGRKAAIEIRDKKIGEFDKRINNFREDIQNKINAGDISLEEGQIEFDTFIEIQDKQFQKEFASEFDKILTPKQIAANKRLDKLSSDAGLKTAVVTLPITFLTGVGLGILATSSKAAAVGIGVVGIGSIILEIPTVAAATLKGDLTPLTTGAVQFVGFGIGAVAGARFGAKIKGVNIDAIKVEAVIDRAITLSPKILAENLKILQKVKLSKGFETEIRTFVDKGYNVAFIESRLAVKKGLPTSISDAKILPDIRSFSIVVTARDGSIIGRTGLGKVLVGQKGKVFTRDLVIRGMGRIDKGKLDVFTRTEVFELKGRIFKKFKKIDEIETIEEAIVKETIKKPKERKIKSIIDVETGLVGAEFLPTGLKPLLEVAKVTKKPVSKTRVLIEEKFTDIFGTIKEVKKPFTKDIEVKFGEVTGKLKRSDIFGVGITEPIITAKLTKIQLKAIKTEKIKQRRIEQQRAKEIKEFNKNLDELSSLEVLTPKQLKAKQTPMQKQIAKQQEQLASVISVPEVVTKKVSKKVLEAEAKTKLKLRQNLQTPLAILDLSQIQDLSLQQKQFTEQIQDLSQIQELTQFKVQSGFQDLKQAQDLKQFNKQLQKLNQVQDLDLQLRGGFDFGIVTPTPIPPTPKPPKPVPPPVVLFDFDDKAIIPKIKKDIELVDLFIKSKGKRSKVADNISLGEGLDLGSQITDNVLAAEFSFNRNQKGARKKPPFQPQKNYYDFNQNKFRDFKIKKGKQIKLKDTFIEKRNRRLDTGGEVGNITALRFIKSKQKKAKGRKDISKALNSILGFG